jgi:hypothetical protein
MPPWSVVVQQADGENHDDHVADYGQEDHHFTPPGDLACNVLIISPVAPMRKDP